MKKNIIAIAAACLLVGIIYFGFTDKPPKKSSFDERREKLIDSLNYPNAKELTDLQHDMLRSEGGSKSALLKQLSQEWLELGQPSISADYLRQLADNDTTYENYMNAGSALSSLIDFESNDELRVNVVYSARYCFEEALKLKPGDVDAKIGLASVLVSGTNSPMEGIMMLREIAEQDPGNIKANLELGKFAVMSRQFDRALERFKVVLEKDSVNLQARYLLAQSYIGLTDTAAAIGEFKKIQTLTSDSLIINQVQQDINNLK